MGLRLHPDSLADRLRAEVTLGRAARRVIDLGHLDKAPPLPRFEIAGDGRLHYRAGLAVPETVLLQLTPLSTLRQRASVEVLRWLVVTVVASHIVGSPDRSSLIPRKAISQPHESEWRAGWCRP